MKSNFAILAGVLILGATEMRAAGAQDQPLTIPPPNDILARLKKEHPRLLASAAEFAQLKQRVAADPQLKAWHATLRTRAERLLTEPPSRYEIPDGLRLLATSRRVVDRVYVLALLYRLDGDRRYAERAWQELDAAAKFPDWNPRHFLDTAEMTHAFAIGYDWLYDFWTPEQRAALRTAMVEKGIKLANEVERKHTWWAAARHNWNQVCNGGIGMGALAIADEAPEAAGEFLHAALRSLQLPMAEFAPDGAWAEGPGYWNYATSYNVVILAALETALGTDFGLSQMPGFAEAGMFPIYATSPLGRTFNYADAHDGPIRAPQMFWLARQFHRPVYAAYERSLASPQAQDLTWYEPGTTAASLTELPLDKYFRHADVVTLRSAWENRDALFVGFKAGDNKANHSHLDLGTFALDALGVRWAGDLGSDDYNLPGYFGKQRWTYYRLRTEGHNTLVINPGEGPDQNPSAAGRMIRFESKPQRAFAIADLTPAYALSAEKVQRGIALLDRKAVLVQDEIKASKLADVWWFLHTATAIQVDPSKTTAVLTQGNARLRATILAPSDAGFVTMDAEPLASSPHPQRQAQNAGVRKLAVHVIGATDLRLAILLVPLRENEAPPVRRPGVVPLEQW
ncbi:MAG: DUF4962 domain-containing protein [Limisphaerales bacterium]